MCFLQEQYIFVYDVLLEALICGDTTMAAATFPVTLSEMLEYDQSIGKTKLEEQFEVQKFSRFSPSFFDMIFLAKLHVYRRSNFT